MIFVFELFMYEASGPPVLKLPDVTGTPSITKSGSCEALNEPMPLIRMLWFAPGWPELPVMVTPLVMPCNFCSTLITGTFFIMSAFTVLAEPVNEDLVKLPYPVTTTSSNSWSSGCMAMFSLLLCMMRTSCVFIPK